VLEMVPINLALVPTTPIQQVARTNVLSVRHGDLEPIAECQ
jgi:hypothetical protein